MQRLKGRQLLGKSQMLSRRAKPTKIELVIVI